MDQQQLVALVMFALVTTASPGPNNIMLMTSGAHIGFMRTLPHMLGIVIGFSLMVILVGVGLSGLFEAYPMIHSILQAGCILYLFYLAVMIATSKPAQSEESAYKPMSFVSAVLFQWVNPKAWSMAVSAVSLFSASSELKGILMVALIFAVINIPSVTVWVFAGKKLQALLHEPGRVRLFNYAMAGLLLVSVLEMTGSVGQLLTLG
ncbi:LysE family translocator [Dongshaea marina]|uniref:LysE family translocator n=1 Tax=Dongshaea marina TaxID=2047966 RepID=UPI000D3E94F3|nr:LysE family translocator [Dongshaea marina]